VSDEPHAQLLQQSQDLLRELTDEGAALVAGDYEALAKFAERKSALVQSLETLYAAAQSAATTPIVREALEGVLRHCRKQNLANAALLEARQQQIRWALAHLGLSRGTFYDASGASVTNFSTRNVGAA
jgi:flagellar biosynthesis/type III secretory pathway chaperone